MIMRLLIPLSLFILSSSPTALACPDVDGLLDLNCDGIVKVTCFGDSITFGRADEEGLGYPGRLGEIFPNIEIVNAGVPGEDTYRGNERAADVFEDNSDSDFFITLQGINDYFRTGRNAFLTRNNLFSIVDRGEDQGGISLLSTLTEIRRDFQKGWVNSVNSAIRSETTIDFFSLGDEIISGDQIHPDGDGYQEMAELVAEILLEETAAERPIDTDVDGIYDFAEVKFGSNPNVADSDGDGILDGVEVFQFGSSPISLDSDADGRTDAFEVSIGANPADARPTPPVVQAVEVLPPE